MYRITKNRFGEIFRQIQRTDDPGDFKGRPLKLCVVFKTMVDFQDFELISTWTIVHFESSRGIVQRFRGEDGQDRSQVFSRCYKASLYCDTARIFQLGGTGTSTADWKKFLTIALQLKKKCNST